MKIRIDMRESARLSPLAQSKHGLPLLHEGIYEAKCVESSLKTSKSGQQKYLEVAFQVTEEMYGFLKVRHRFFLCHQSKGGSWQRKANDISWRGRRENKDVLMLQTLLQANQKNSDLLSSAENLINLSAMLYIHLIRQEIGDDENQLQAILNPSSGADQMRILIERNRLCDDPYWLLEA